MIAEPPGKKVDRAVMESKLRFLKEYLSDCKLLSQSARPVAVLSTRLLCF